LDGTYRLGWIYTTAAVLVTFDRDGRLIDKRYLQAPAKEMPRILKEWGVRQW
jgi:hypothetical protein